MNNIKLMNIKWSDMLGRIDKSNCQYQIEYNYCILINELTSTERAQPSLNLKIKIFRKWGYEKTKVSIVGVQCWVWGVEGCTGQVLLMCLVTASYLYKAHNSSFMVQSLYYRLHTISAQACRQVRSDNMSVLSHISLRTSRHKDFWKLPTTWFDFYYR